VERLNEITSVAAYPSAAMLFIEGQQGRGVFVLCSGKAKLSMTSREAKTIIMLCLFEQKFLGLCSALIKVLMKGVSEFP
jgi:hypothetical protein